MSSMSAATSTSTSPSTPPQPPRAPLVAIIGATGTGKSQLAVDLALRLGGEVVNADAMQLYAGLPVTTNQLAPAARRGVPHHLLGCVARGEEAWSVDGFVGRARGVIEEIRSRGRLPILVGGTHYYMQGLLFRNALVAVGDGDGHGHGHGEGEGKSLSPAEAEAKWPILGRPTAEIWARLNEVDPVMARRWHPNDRRKISRSLEIWLTTGRKASDIYEEQQRERLATSGNGDAAGVESVQGSEHDAETRSGMRFDTLVLWTHTEKEALSKRIHARVKTMVSEGLVDEAQSLFDFLKLERSKGNSIDQTRGIWVSIGFKEFVAYLEAREDDSTDIKKRDALLEEAIDRTEIHTRQYANYQIKWIRHKLLQALREASSRQNIFVLDASDPSDWLNAVSEPAADIVERFLKGDSLPDSLQMSSVARDLLIPDRDFDISHRKDLWIRQTCDVCGTIALSTSDWEKHIKSRGHRKLAKAQRKQDGVRVDTELSRNDPSD